MKLVLDASMALSWLFERTHAKEADCSAKVLSSVVTHDFVVPVLWHTEVANALLVGERSRVVTEAQVVDYLQRLSALPIETDDSTITLRTPTVMALARTYKLTAYDATYLELAMRNQAMLASFDKALITAAQKAGVVVYMHIDKRLHQG